MSDTPEHLRLFASLAFEDAEHWRNEAKVYPQRCAKYLAWAEQREDDARYFLEKADRDERWTETEGYMKEAAE